MIKKIKSHKLKISLNFVKAIIVCLIVITSGQLVFAEESDNETQKSDNQTQVDSCNRFGLISLSAGFGGGNIGLELLAYEHVGKNRFSIRIVPLNLNVTLKGYSYTETSTQKLSGGITYSVTGDADVWFVNYAPIWIRYYMGGDPENRTRGFYLGLGAVYHMYEKTPPLGEPEEKNSIQPAIEIGRQLSNAAFGLRVFKGSGEKEDVASIMAYCGITFD